YHPGGVGRRRREGPRCTVISSCLMSSGHDATVRSPGSVQTTTAPRAGAGGPRAGTDGPDVRGMKFGGTSVGDIERIKKVAARVEQALTEGVKAVVVVSAMGRTTDRLLSWAREIAARPSRRELDVLATTGEQQ